MHERLRDEPDCPCPQEPSGVVGKMEISVASGMQGCGWDHVIGNCVGPEKSREGEQKIFLEEMIPELKMNRN